MHSWNTCCEVHMLCRRYSQGVFTAPVVAAVMSKLSVAVFKTINKQWCNVSCNKILERDWTSGGTQFGCTVPFFCRSGPDLQDYISSITKNLKFLLPTPFCIGWELNNCHFHVWWAPLRISPVQNKLQTASPLVASVINTCRRYMS